ncbi:abscisic-aldehyde oxidase isoform X3 [Ricinus communis]|uniref:abscisic-aldehyde oxidase isoform X3 n=1 Tax=Ricinus communis TaxID=3988 RepID=UPI00201B20A6|nr:abscisic-aldehyde oxidase isoform X3 [Ricinus communis]
MGEERSKAKEKYQLVFAINGVRFELSSVHPSTTLLHFLRTDTAFKSVKLSCGEGGCGACVVLLSKYNPVLDKVEDFTVSSCLTLLCSINGCSVITSDGLGNNKDGFHSIHQRFAGFHASQCGFCTPGMCVSLFGALVNAEKTDQFEPSSRFSKLTVIEAEKAISGNLCRCTGYRPIADACKSFASDVDMEDLGFNSFWKKEDCQEIKISKLPDYNRKICTFPEFLKSEVTKSSWFLDSESYSWYKPGSIEELQSLLEATDANNGVQMKLVVGNTSVSYYKELEQYDRYIDLSCIPELSIIRMDQSGIEIGATVTISKAIEALKEESKGEYKSDYKMVLRKIAVHMEKIATQFVRNLSSVGGNLVMAQRNSFPSDIATILVAAGSFVCIMTGTLHEKLTLEEFLGRPPLDLKSVLVSLRIPNYRSNQNISPKKGSKLLFETYRAAPRPLGNALAYMNAAFLVDVIWSSGTSGGIVINSCQLAFGAFGTKHAIRAKEVEEFLTGKMLSDVVLYEAIKLVKATIVPEDGTLYPTYRSSLAVAFLFDFLSPLIETLSDGWLNEHINISMFKDAQLKQNNDWMDPVKFPTLLSSSKQVVQINKEYQPIGAPIMKSGAALQASGEVVYVDDIPSPQNCLYGSFIYSTKPFARIKRIELNSKSDSEGVIALISFRDIPKGGENIGSIGMYGHEPLFADELTRHSGERLALVVADTQKHADLTSELAVVDYDFENLEPPILTTEEAIKRSSFFEFEVPKHVGDVSKGMAEADYKIISIEITLDSQYFYYMENQTALAVPDEDNCVVVYASIQYPQYAHTVIARCLGVPENNVRVVTRRLGGSFGGKATKAMPVATACALAAHKLQRPVRMYLNRKNDMKMAGGRHPMKVTYSVGFKMNGKITALQLDISILAGIYPDWSPRIPILLIGALKKYNWGALSFDIKVCKTNHLSRTAMRAPGQVQATFIAEAVMEHVASFLSMDTDVVRAINLHTYESLNLFYGHTAGNPMEYTLISIWDKLATSSNLNQRIKMVKKFNRCNVWKKRGISRIPVIHEVMLRPIPGKVGILNDGSIVVEVGGIEMGQGLWTKVKQMVVFALSPIKCNGAGDLLDKVRVVQYDSLSLIQSGITAGSTTSESSCEAVRICCKTLVERLQPLKERLQMQLSSITWEILINQVEVDLLTGETIILRSDIIYDCGQSLNPAVDLGQIEGAFVQGIGFFMLEEYTTDSNGLVVQDGTWNYKIPTIDTIPKHFNVEILNSGHHQNHILSSKGIFFLYP